jgi:anti-sigma regulatory factor (Ser/Thr protein kinase)
MIQSTIGHAKLDDLRRREAAMQTKTPKMPEAITFERDYPGTLDQARRVRADLSEVAGTCLVADELVLLASELAANAILHSRSGHPGHEFTVRMTLYPGEYAWVEVIDQGGAWTAGNHDGENGRGLTIVAAVAGDGNWGIEGNTSSRVAWFRLEWPRR